MPFNERVEYYISRIIEKFKENPELFLTESDLKCRLFMELNNDPVFSQEEPTRDGKKRTSYVHSETAYFVDGKLIPTRTFEDQSPNLSMNACARLKSFKISEI